MEERVPLQDLVFPLLVNKPVGLGPRLAKQKIIYPQMLTHKKHNFEKCEVITSGIYTHAMIIKITMYFNFCYNHCFYCFWIFFRSILSTGILLCRL